MKDCECKNVKCDRLLSLFLLESLQTFHTGPLIFDTVLSDSNVLPGGAQFIGPEEHQLARQQVLKEKPQLVQGWFSPYQGPSPQFSTLSTLSTLSLC